MDIRLRVKGGGTCRRPTVRLTAHTLAGLISHRLASVDSETALESRI